MRDFHLDWVALAFLILGLVLSALDYRDTSRQLASLEVAARKVQSFVVDIDVEFASDWKDKVPRSPRVMVGGPAHVAEIDLAVDSGDIHVVKLFMDKEPSFGPTPDGKVHTTFRLRAEPGTWPIASDVRSLRAVKRLAFVVYGIRLADSKDGVFAIGGTARVLINGTEAAVMNQSAQSADLARLSLGEKNPEMSFNGTYPIRLGLDGDAGRGGS